MGLSSVHAARGDYAESIKASERAIAIFDKLTIKVNGALARVSLAEAYLALERLPEAMESLQTALKSAQDARMPGSEAKAWTVLARIHMKMADVPAARACLMTARELFSEIGDQPSVTLMDSQLAALPNSKPARD